MSSSTVDVQIGGITVRVPMYGSMEDTRAIVEAVNSRLGELEAKSGKVNTQAFALQAAYEFAIESVQLREEVAKAEDDIVGVVQDLTRRLETFREQVEESADLGA